MLMLCFLVFAVLEGAESLTVTQAPTNTSGLIGGNATLTCTVTNKQNSDSIKWYQAGDSNPLTLNDLPVNNNGHHVISGTYNLVIVNLTLDDQAQYTCDAQGSQYTGSLTVVDLPTNLSVYWVEHPEAGSTKNLSCLASRGHPPPSLSWYKNGVALDNSRATYTGATDQYGYGEAVSILPVSLSSGDEGALFECEASYDNMPNALTANLTLSFNATSGQESCKSCGSLCQEASKMEDQWEQKLTPSLAYWFYSYCGVQSCPDFAAFAADVAELLKKQLCDEN